MKKLIIIDGHALAYRSFYALPPLVSPSGVLVNGVYGFLLVFLKILNELKPDYLISTFDLKGITFRHLQYKEYKAKRVKAPEDFYKQIEIIKEFLEAFNVLILEKEGFEADDIIATVVNKLKNEEIEIIILTGDLDTLQLVSDKVSVYTFKKGFNDTIIYTPKKIEEKYGLKPWQLIDFKALKGDPSDNISGVPSIGEKTALNLIKKYQNLDNLYNLIEKEEITDISKKIINTLKEHKKEAYLSRELVILKKDVGIDFNLEKALFKKPEKEKLIPLLEKYGFKSLISKIFNLLEEEKKPLSENKSLITYCKEEDLQKLLEKIENEKEIGLLLDFQGEKIYEREVFGIGIVFKDNNLFYLPKDYFEIVFNNKLSLKEKKIITYEAKILMEEIPYFSNYLLDDLKIKAWLIDSERKNYSLEELIRYFLKEDVLFDFSLKLSKIFALNEVLESKLISLDLYSLYETIEKPLIPILKKMEERGILIAEEKLALINSRVSQRLLFLEDEIYKKAGEVFNINSSLQLVKILFEKLKIESKNLRKTPTGKISTDSEELKKIKDHHPIIPLILEYKELKKIKSAFLDLLPSFINKKTKRIHTIFNQTGTATGRLSSEKPNFQNIPSKGEWGKEIRSCFIAENGFIFLSLDYSQIELRLAAHLSFDSILKEVFLNNLDIHKITASKINNVPLEKVTPLMREQAKILNFSIIYGIGDRALAEALNVSLKQAKIFKEEYFSEFVGLKLYLDRAIEEAKRKGYVETLFKRKRFLPLIGSYGRVGKEEERIAINMPIQGLCSDLIKLAMIKIDNYLKENHLEDKVFLISQIHDELLFEVKSEIIDKVKGTLKEIMENVYPLSVPLKTELKIGKNWGEMEEG